MTRAMTRALASDSKASAIRSLFRAAVLIATSFGLKLTAEQVAGIQLGVEAVIQALRSWYTKDI